VQLAVEQIAQQIKTNRSSAVWALSWLLVNSAHCIVLVGDFREKLVQLLGPNENYVVPRRQIIERPSPVQYGTVVGRTFSRFISQLGLAGFAGTQTRENHSVGIITDAAAAAAAAFRDATFLNFLAVVFSASTALHAV